MKISEVRALLPDLTMCREDMDIVMVLDTIEATFGCFGGLTESKRETALKWAIAHYLFVTSDDPLAQGGQVQSIKNKQDRISYVAPYVFDVEGSFGLSSSKYGATLRRILRYGYQGGVLTGTTC